MDLAEGHGREMGLGRLVGVEEPGIQLSGRQAPEQVLLGKDVGAVLENAGHRRVAVDGRRLLERLHGELALGVEGRVGASHPKARLGDDLVPGLGLALGREAGPGVVAQQQGRLGEGRVPRHPVTVGHPHQGLVGLGTGTDEHIALSNLALDVLGQLRRATGEPAQGVTGRGVEGRANAVLHKIHQGTGIEHGHVAAPPGRGGRDPRAGGRTR